MKKERTQHEMIPYFFSFIFAHKIRYFASDVITGLKLVHRDELKSLSHSWSVAKNYLSLSPKMLHM